MMLVNLALALHSAAPGDNLPMMKSNSEAVTIRVDERLITSAWRLTPELKPDEYLVDVAEGRPVTVSFITDVDSIGFRVALGDTCDFIIHWDGQDCWTRIVGREFVPAANFDAAYREAHRGTIAVSIPEVYELVNVAIALSPFGRDNPGYVYQKSAYYATVMDRFEPFRDHALVQELGSLLGRNSGYYASLKMNGFSFEFDDDGRIASRPEFDRTGFPSQRENLLRPFLPLMQSFADDTRFREFYTESRPVYEGQIACYRDSLDVEGMRSWLDDNFPSGGGYDFYDIVFSPLVAYNQSSTWFESNGFRELQPHVNFPYPRDFVGLQPASPTTIQVYRGTIVFTELNHGYINPAGEAYADRISAAVANRDAWVDPSDASNNYRGNGVFFEYLNWALVSLRIADLVPEEEQERLIEMVEGNTRGRGFIRFPEFDRFLLDIYRNRAEGKTLESLYPQIVTWFEARR
jgi:hypothetical protein